MIVMVTKMQRREFLKLTVSLAAVGLTNHAFANSAGTGTGTGNFTVFSASDDSQRLNRLSIWQSSNKQSQHFIIPFRAHDILPFADQQRVLAFGRRPEMQCVVVDTEIAENQLMDAAEGRHFFGHGCFTEDNTTLFTTESEYDEARGVIGIRDAKTLDIIGEYDSYGVGPHDMHLMPDGKTLVIANGGIETHPDYGRRKLNIDTMQPSLVYVDVASGKKIDEYRLSDHKLSIRHLVVSAAGDVGVATQYQGDTYREQPQTLVAWQPYGKELQEIAIPAPLTQSIRGYMADIAFDDQNQVLAVTAPRGNRLTLWDTRESKLLQEIELAQPSGIQYVAAQQRFIVSTAKGSLLTIKLDKGQVHVDTLYSDPNTTWDNHLVIT